ncbi:hypothetical protein TNCV_3810451 [Trichonephila clavipes]|nr:hypothetical protein TNCV_3810451 [Trichonephila clavipes]
MASYIFECQPTIYEDRGLRPLRRSCVPMTIYPSVPLASPSAERREWVEWSSGHMISEKDVNPPSSKYGVDIDR